MRRIAVWLSYAMFFAVPWEKSISIAGAATVTRMVGLLMAAVWVLAVLRDGKLRRWRLFHVALCLFVLWNLATALWTLDITETQARLMTYVQLLVLVIVLWDLYVTPGIMQGGLQAFLFGGWVAIISTFINYSQGKEIAEFSGGRYSASGVSPGDMVLMLAMGLPIAWYLASTAGSDRKAQILRWVNYAYVPAALFAVGLSAARMGLFALVPALIYILATTTRFKVSTRMVIYAAILAGLIALPAIIPASAVERLSTTGDSIESADLGGRVALWREAFGLFSQHPVLGIGSSAFHGVSEEQIVVHNTYLSVLTETGLVGFAIFLSILALAAYSSVHQPREYGRLWLVILMIWAIGVSVQTWEYVKATWLFLSLVVISANLPRVPDARQELKMLRPRIWDRQLKPSEVSHA